MGAGLVEKNGLAPLVKMVTRLYLAPIFSAFLLVFSAASRYRRLRDEIAHTRTHLVGLDSIETLEEDDLVLLMMMP